MRLLIIVPTYNERETIQYLVETVLSENPPFNILIVDDASPDGTGDLADELASNDSRIHVLHRSGKQGIGTAYLEGFRYALAGGYDHVVQMDADLSHRPQDLLRLVAAAEDCDVVIGSRNIPGGQVEHWSLLRRIVSRGGSLYARQLLALPIHDCTSGFKCFRRSVLQSIDLGHVASNGYGFQVEVNYLCHRAGYRIVEVPIVFPDRSAGRSKMSFSILIEAAVLVWKLRRGSARAEEAGRLAREAPVHAEAPLPDIINTQ